MREKNTLLTIKDPRNDEIIVIRPVTSMYNVEGLQEYISKKFAQFLTKIKGIFVMQEEGKGLSEHNFSTEYKNKLDDLSVNNVTEITINGEKVETVDGTVTITTEALVESMSDADIENIFSRYK